MKTESALLNPRLAAARPDLADARLRGRVAADTFVDGWPRHVLAEIADLKRAPRADAAVDTQLLHGETVLVFEDHEGWSWVQADRDGYVGYVTTSALGAAPRAATHRVIVNRTFVYPAPDIKSPVETALPLDSRLAVEHVGAVFAALAGGGHVVASHLAAVDRRAADFVAVAEQLVGAPYLWGGKSVGGIDCSGLVQLAASLAGIALPRDSDLQETVEHAREINAATDGLARGDLVFWRGHVGVLVDGDTLLHANAHHMLVTREPLHAAQHRIERMAGLRVSSIRRLQTG